MKRKSSRRVVGELIDAAICEYWLDSMRRKKIPGEWILKLSPEEREILQNLKQEDVNDRWLSDYAIHKKRR